MGFNVQKIKNLKRRGYSSISLHNADKQFLDNIMKHLIVRGYKITYAALFQGIIKKIDSEQLIEEIISSCKEGEGEYEE